ncbi:hypothetical protein GALMADRAFT_257846 [Galerina marginata CBS 339.88]|uniref:Cyclase n=1 Tax=Galerina marginata (strain CBS 339.88) TaxID=685588 RepID=A0A067S9V1_GALM3|nr:hypothetical protein GALMADRAFT_257846 [Galerina marginata CBS 339.88]
MGTHTGTHIDAPYHFFPDGRKIDQIPLNEFIGEAVVIDLSHGLIPPDAHGNQARRKLKERYRITWDDLEPFSHGIQPGCILLINTGWSKAYYQTATYFHHPYIAPEVASILLWQGVRVVGVDTLSPDETLWPGVECGDDEFGFHETFLQAGGLIAENLTNLEELVEAKVNSVEEKWIVNLVPLNLAGADGSPVRAFAYNTKR